MKRTIWSAAALVVLCALTEIHAAQYSATLLHPLSAYRSSYAADVSGSSQVGYGHETSILGNDHALLWSGTAESVVDLNPPGFTYSRAWGVSGSSQVGHGSGDATLD
jgi:hypothetical protein